MPHRFSVIDLERFLDENLPHDRMAEIEAALRDDSELADQVAAVVGRMDAGVHSLGAIWRSHRLSCPTREQLGSFLLNVLDEDETGYVRFHLESVGCRFCAASLDDLREQHETTSAQVADTRRRKYFQSSAGYLSEDA